MSKISEQKAFEAYPIAYYRNGGGIDDANASDRTVYEEGYDQAMQDFLKKAEKYLKSLTFHEFAGAQPERVMDDYDIEEFKNYMKNESEK